MRGEGHLGEHWQFLEGSPPDVVFHLAQELEDLRRDKGPGTRGRQERVWGVGHVRAYERVSQPGVH